MSAVKDNVIRLYDVKPEMALEHLKRSTGLDFDNMPQNLAALVRGEATAAIMKTRELEQECAPPILTDIVAVPAG